MDLIDILGQPTCVHVLGARALLPSGIDVIGAFSICSAADTVEECHKTAAQLAQCLVESISGTSKSSQVMIQTRKPDFQLEKLFHNAYLLVLLHSCGSKHSIAKVML